MTDMAKAVLLTAATAMLCACGWPTPCGGGGADGSRMQLAALNAEFARVAVQRGPAEAFRRVLADDAVFLAANYPALYGPDDIVAFLDGAPGVRMSWTTADAEVASGCDVGYTFGAWNASGADTDGNPVALAGKYAAVWRRPPDGAWRLAVYIQNTDPADDAGQ